METKELIAAYNKAIQEGMTSEDFAHSIGMQRKSIQQKARRAGYIFQKEKNQYVLKQSNSISEIPVQENQGDVELKKIEKELRSIKKRIEKLEQESIAVVCTKEVGHTDLPLQEFTTPVKQISYRYHLEVLEALERICKRYPHL